MSGGEQPGERLRAKVLQGLSWSILQTWGTHVITFSVFLVTARLLGPETFGPVVIAYVVLGALSDLLDVGMRDALIRARDAEQAHFDTVLWGLMGSALVLLVTAWMSSPWLADALDQPALDVLLRVVVLSLPVTALGIVPDVILRRSLRFRPAALSSLIASIVGGALAITLAVAGFGYWALVARGLIEPLVATVLVWKSISYRPRLSFALPIWKALFATGRPLVGSRVIAIASQRADAFILSTWLGATQLALYSAAQRIYQSMMDAMFIATQRVTLPAFSQITNDQTRTQQALLRMVRLTSFVTFPMFAFVALLADPLVPILFGPRWADCALVLTVFCLGGILFSVSNFNAPLMTAAGRPELVFRLTAVNTTLNLVGCLIGVRWGIVGVAVAFTLRGYLVFPLNLALLRSAVGLSRRRYLLTLAPNLGATALSATLVALAAYVLPGAVGPLPRLLLLGLVAVLVHIAVLLVLCRRTVAIVLGELESMGAGTAGFVGHLHTLRRWASPRERS